MYRWAVIVALGVRLCQISAWRTTSFGIPCARISRTPARIWSTALAYFPDVFSSRKTSFRRFPCLGTASPSQIPDTVFPCPTHSALAKCASTRKYAHPAPRSAVTPASRIGPCCQHRPASQTAARKSAYPTDCTFRCRSAAGDRKVRRLHRARPPRRLRTARH